jgi:hypothetical protein
MTRGQASAILAAILQPINESAGIKQSPFVNHTLGQFVEQVYLPVYKGKWKLSTAMTEIHRLRYHLVGSLGELGIARSRETSCRSCWTRRLTRCRKVLSRTFDFGCALSSSWH